MVQKIYLAGPLFNAEERLHNSLLERELKALGHKAILPQREALNAFDGKNFNTVAIVESCKEACSDPETIVVACADGPDADSGTCIEYGIAIALNCRAIVYRTDFRTNLEKEVGVNAMLMAKGTIFIYEPCFFTELDQVGPYYKKLALRIHEAIQKLNS